MPQHAERRTHSDVIIRVEGGNGASQSSPSNTRCAALTCSSFLESGVKAEQNCRPNSHLFYPIRRCWRGYPSLSLTRVWPAGQGFSHGLLRLELQSAALNEPGYVANQSIILFTFRPDNNGPDGIAARVLVMEDLGTVDEVVGDRVTLQNRESKRAEGQNATLARKSFTTAELRARIKAGQGYEHVVPANLTYVSSCETREQASTSNTVCPTRGAC